MQGLYALLIIPMLGILIFVHELGHFLTARAVGITVKEFGFGFPPRLFSVKRGGVIYSFNAIFLGGFVKMEGENGDSEDPNSFGKKKPWQRAVVLAAGSVMNVVLAVIIFIGLGMAGEPTALGDVAVSDISAGSPAAVAGLQKGDVIVSMNGQKVDSTTALHDATQQNLGKPITLDVRRNGTEFPVQLTPRMNPPQGEGAMGVQIEVQNGRIVNVRYGLIQSIVMGFQRAAEVFVLIIAGIIGMIQGVIAPDLAGPIGMGQLTSEVVVRSGGGWPAAASLLQFTALLSIQLFIINLLPLPALDGGRMAFVGIEAARRGKRIPPEKEGYIHFVGIMVLFAAMLVISYFDVLRVVTNGSVLP